MSHHLPLQMCQEAVRLEGFPAVTVVWEVGIVKVSENENGVILNALPGITDTSFSVC